MALPPRHPFQALFPLPRRCLSRAAAGAMVGLASLASAGCAAEGSDAPATPNAAADVREEAARPQAREPVPVSGLVDAEPEVTRVISSAGGNEDNAAPADPVVAEVGDVRVTRSELFRPLADAYGLNVLLSMIRLGLAKSEAAELGRSVTDADVTEERRKTLAKLFEQAGADAQPEEHEQLLAQFLAQQGLSETEFELAMRTNALLRTIAAPQIAGKLTDDDVRQAFNARYGESVRVRHVALSNLQEVADARRRLEAGETFAAVAQSLSKNPRTGPLGGEIAPFNRQNPYLPEVFKEAAFSLQPGEMSDPVQADGQYHLILMEEKLEPQAVKFEDERAALRAELEEQIALETMKVLRDELGRRALASMTIYDPALKAQFDARVAEQQATIQDEEEIRSQLELERAAAATRPADEPADQPAPAPETTPTPTPATAPATAPAE